MKKLRLLLFEDCNRKCPGCCNKDWNLDKLEVCTHFNYDEVLLTGGEPMIRPDIVKKVIYNIRMLSNAKIYMYTAYLGDNFLDILEMLDGITLTLHEQKDVKIFEDISGLLIKYYKDKSFRLNVFEGIILPYGIDLRGWKVKMDMKWIKNCSLPEDEVFQKLKEMR